MTRKSLIAVLGGAGFGVFAAVGWRSAPDAQKPPPLAPAAARAFDLSHAEGRERAARSEPSVASRAPAEASPEPTPGAPASAPPSVTPLMAVDGEAAIASEEEFEKAAIACDGKDAGACRRAAAAADLGVVVRKDPERAKTFRRVELTVLVRGCEKRSVEACLTLADRYLRGEGVAQSERTAIALLEHTREICAKRPEDACRNVPAN
jgi:hypothetical protein